MNAGSNTQDNTTKSGHYFGLELIQYLKKTHDEAIFVNEKGNVPEKFETAIKIRENWHC